MGSRVKNERLRVGGMSCVSCQYKIEKKLRNTAGVQSAKVDYGTGIADITYDADIVSRADIAKVIEKLGYRALPASQKTMAGVGRITGILAIIVALYMLLQHAGLLNLLAPGQLADTSMGYGMLFVIGLITSVHCVAMCGGINLSQCVPKSTPPKQPKTAGESQAAFSAFAPAILYNLGRVLSYTAIGFILGLVGMLFGGAGGVGLSPMAQGLLKIAAGAFMVIMGINMLDLFPFLRKLQPHMPAFLARKINADKSRSKSPLIVGLLNGLMPCGPLQSMQIVALATGNPLAGALSMLLFSLGTVPLMLVLGSLVAALGRKFTRQMMRIGAVMVDVLGLAMLEQGGSLSGLLQPDVLLALILGLAALGIVSSVLFRRRVLKSAAMIVVAGVAVIALLPRGAVAAKGAAANESLETVPELAQISGQQVITSTLSGGRYPNITVQAGVPVKWVVDAPEGSINGCNYKINIPEYGIANYAFEAGENVIEFTPTKTGKFLYSCWMGMLQGSITVVEGEVAAQPIMEPAAYPELETEAAPQPGCCG
ncbi:MAG: sulfite exporter TauE/SafE family protein [Candidatus Pelethousia sp.]|nr:sulfite exporter TauE/SafE family protein [Candidatus Pelethousia sp.]